MEENNEAAAAAEGAYSLDHLRHWMPRPLKHLIINFGIFNRDVDFKAGVASQAWASPLFQLESASEWLRVDPVLNIPDPFFMFWHVLRWLYNGAIIP